MPADTSRKALVAAVKIRWRIERDYQELKQEFGLDNFEGRNWRGFHHHATLCIAAYGFLIGERLTRSKSTKKNCAFRTPPTLPEAHARRPRRFVLNDTSLTRSQPCAGRSPLRSLNSCRPSMFARVSQKRDCVRNTVRLIGSAASMSARVHAQRPASDLDLIA